MSALIIVPLTPIDPILNLNAIRSALQQQEVGHVTVLAIHQGGETPDLPSFGPDVTVLEWRHDPPLPSLGATWNCALDFAFRAGFPDALVINNDVELPRNYYRTLRSLRQARDLWLCSGIGKKLQEYSAIFPGPQWITDTPLGGPDFSAFLVTPEGHAHYPFDTVFQPAYHEDNDLVRRYWLGGHGAKIAGVALPFLHHGSQTINRSPAEAEKFRKKFDACRAKYIEKWGGVPHQETKVFPYGISVPADLEEGQKQVATPGGWPGATLPPVMVHDSVCLELPERLHGLLNDGLALTSGPDDGYRGIPREAPRGEAQ